MPHLSRAAAAVMLTVAMPSFAQETVDIGVLQDGDVSVVQNLLYPKEDTIEVGVHLGWMPFDTLVTTPNLQISVDYHLREDLAVSAVLGGGYGFETFQYNELAGPAYGIAPYAFRYLGSALIGASWSPIYGKMSANGRKVVHYDVFFAPRIGATLEQSVIPDVRGADGSLADFGLTGAPTLSLGLGARFFVGDGLAVVLGIREDMLAEYRRLTGSWHFKQNANVTLGVSFFLGGK